MRAQRLIIRGNESKLAFRFQKRAFRVRVICQPVFDQRQIRAGQRAAQIEGQQRFDLVAAGHLCVLAHGQPLSYPAAFKASPSFFHCLSRRFSMRLRRPLSRS